MQANLSLKSGKKNVCILTAAAVWGKKINKYEAPDSDSVKEEIYSELCVHVCNNLCSKNSSQIYSYWGV